MKKGLYFVAAGVAFGVFVFGLQQVLIRKVVCVNQVGQCSAEVLGVIEEFKGKSYSEARNALARRFSGNPRLESFKISFNLPDVLVVNTVERVPEIAAKFGENSYFLFDKNGISLGEVAETSLPVIVVYEVPVGEKFSFAMRLSREVMKYYVGRDMRVDKYGLYGKVQNGVEVVLPLEGDVDVLLGALEVILSQLNGKPENPTISLESGKSFKIDLRYKNPVISQI